MTNRLISGVAVALTLSLGVAPRAGAQHLASPSGRATGARVDGRYAEVNGVRLYYELHGANRAGKRPLVLLHGSLGAGSMFGRNLPALAAGRQVILVDLQGHGRTADVDRPLTLEAMADDVAALLAHLGIPQADVMGYSMGGGVALQTAVRHPERVRKLVLVSTALRASAYYPEIRSAQKMVNASIAETMKRTQMYQLYRSVAPRPQDFPRLLDKMGALMQIDFDYSAQLAAVKAPTLMIAGDADVIPPTHLVEAFALRDGGKHDGGWDGAGRSARGQLAILPGLTHYTIFDAPALASTAISFLDDAGQR